jgi:hypothetical protein
MPAATNKRGDEYISTAVAARWTGYSFATLTEGVKHGRIPWRSRRAGDGSPWYFHREDVIRDARLGADGGKPAWAHKRPRVKPMPPPRNTLSWERQMNQREGRLVAKKGGDTVQMVFPRNDPAPPGEVLHDTAQITLANGNEGNLLRAAQVCVNTVAEVASAAKRRFLARVVEDLDAATRME